METININSKVLERISNLVPELNQDKKEINLTLPFYGFSEVFFIVSSLLNASERLLADCSENEYQEVLSISNNLVTIARKLLPINQVIFVDELLLPQSTDNLTKVKQK